MHTDQYAPLFCLKQGPNAGRHARHTREWYSTFGIQSDSRTSKERLTSEEEITMRGKQIESNKQEKKEFRKGKWK